MNALINFYFLPISFDVSVCAVFGGKAVNTSVGKSPVIMGEYGSAFSLVRACNSSGSKRDLFRSSKTNEGQSLSLRNLLELVEVIRDYLYDEHVRVTLTTRRANLIET